MTLKEYARRIFRLRHSFNYEVRLGVMNDILRDMEFVE